MKPTKLKIQAFGPYKDYIEVDFERFNEGLFLLTGKTGSGKTSIFDAICYALFDEASGSVRSKDNVRSDYADSKSKTFVTLDFKDNDKMYSITRYPSYLKDGNKNKTNADALLTFDDISITGQTNVTNKIIEILGIDSKQFKQIAMIAQGEFQNLLFASSKERTGIFRKIFDTSIYNKISEILNSRFLKIKREYEDNKLLINNEISNIVWDLDISNKCTKDILDELLEKIKQDTKEAKLIEKTITDLNNKIVITTKDLSLIEKDNLDIIKLNEKNKELNELTNDLLFFNNLKKEAKIQEKLIPLFIEKNKLNKSIIDNKTNLENNIQRLKILKAEFKIVKEEFLKIENYKFDLESKRLMIEKIEKNNKLKEQIKDITLSLVKPSLDISQLNHELNELEIKTKDNNSKILLGLEIEKQNNDKKLIKELNLKIENIIEKEKKLEKFSKKFNEIKLKYEKTNLEILNMEESFIKNQAGILALELKDDEPCLVCGSKNHPKIAHMDNINFNKEDIDVKKEIFNKLNEEKNNLFSNIYSLKQLIEENNKDKIIEEIENLKNKDYKIKKYQLELEEYQNNLDKILIIKNNIDKTETITKKYNEELVKIKTLESNVEDIKEDILSIRADYEILNKHINDTTLKFNKLNIEISNLENSNIHFNNLIDNLNQDFLIIMEQINKLNYTNEPWKKEELEKTNTNIEDFFYKYNNLLVIIEELKMRVKDKTIIDTKEYKLNLEQFNVDLNNIDKTSINRLNINKKIYDKILNFYNKNEKIEKQYSLYKTLNDTSNGNITGKLKINFEQFVQAYYFEEVIKNSNIRLNIITDGRYELMRKDGSQSGKVALELEVFDYYTGKVRDVKTLSGGEVFKSSLALALGLSDTIQNYAGGINVETLFIDEGFGSLDSESLEQAINTLIDLSSNKVIGIISHVEELKNRIDKKIIVTSSSEGSKIEIVA